MPTHLPKPETTLNGSLTRDGILNAIARKVSKVLGAQVSLETTEIPQEDCADPHTTCIVVTADGKVVANYNLSCGSEGPSEDGWNLTKIEDLLTMEEIEHELTEIYG